MERLKDFSGLEKNRHNINVGETYCAIHTEQKLPNQGIKELDFWYFC